MSRLAVFQSILSGLQLLTAATVLSDVIGQKPAALAIVVVASAQTSLNTYLSKSVAENSAHIQQALSSVGQATQKAEAAAAHAESFAGKG